MIAFLRGHLAGRGADWVDIDVQGVGFHAAISARDAAALPGAGRELTLLTEMLVRDDGVFLYGFLEAEERSAFRALLGVASVGPKTALAILGVFTLRQLSDAIVREDLVALSRVPGVGKKTAQRLCLELKDKLGGPGGPVGLAPGPRSEAASALVSLGYTPAEADAAVAEVASEAADPAGLVRAALRRLGASGQ